MFGIPGKNRRTAPRFPSELETACFPVGEEASDKPWPARVEDISERGLSLILQRRFERGTCLSLELQNKAQKFRRTVVVQVVRVQRHRTGWRLGCHITGQFDPEELGAFRSDNDTGPERAWIRLPSGARTTCSFLESDNGDTYPVEVVNVSPGGVGLLVGHLVEKGTMLRLQVPHSRSKSHRVLARVLHVTPQGKDQWLLGCTFLGELSDRELQSFLD